jgi:hypothetical protein
MNTIAEITRKGFDIFDGDFEFGNDFFIRDFLGVFFGGFNWGSIIESHKKGKLILNGF